MYIYIYDSLQLRSDLPCRLQIRYGMIFGLHVFLRDMCIAPSAVRTCATEDSNSIRALFSCYGTQRRFITMFYKSSPVDNNRRHPHSRKCTTSHLHIGLYFWFSASQMCTHSPRTSRVPMPIPYVISLLNIVALTQTNRWTVRRGFWEYFENQTHPEATVARVLLTYYSGLSKKVKVNQPRYRPAVAQRVPRS